MHSIFDEHSIIEENPLHWAAYKGHISHVRMLIEEGASPLQLDAAGNNAIDIAVKYQQMGVVDELLRVMVEKPDIVKRTLPRHHTALTKTVVNKGKHRLFTVFTCVCGVYLCLQCLPLFTVFTCNDVVSVTKGNHRKQR